MNLGSGKMYVKWRNGRMIIGPQKYPGEWKG